MRSRRPSLLCHLRTPSAVPEEITERAAGGAHEEAEEEEALTPTEALAEYRLTWGLAKRRAALGIGNAGGVESGSRGHRGARTPGQFSRQQEPGGAPEPTGPLDVFDLLDMWD